MNDSAICPFCAVGCGLETDGLAFRGAADHPVNHGALCARGAAATFTPASRDRLLRPLRRAPGAAAWTPIGWDEALDRAAVGLLQARAASWDPARNAAPGIAFLGGATAMNEEVYLFARLAHHLGVLDLDHQGRLCHAATTVGLGATFGWPAATHSWEDLAHAEWILVLGSNLADAHPIAARWLHRARARGARVATVDPRPSRTARASDRHLSPRPGTDVALLGALIREVLARGRVDEAYLRRATDAMDHVDPAAELRGGRFGGFDESARAYDAEAWRYVREGETVLSALRRHFARYTVKRVAAICGLDAADLRHLARMIRGRGAILFSMGITQQASGVAAVRAAAILQALLGNLEGAGGGLYPMKGHANIQGATDLGGLYNFLPGYLPAPTRDLESLDAYAARHGTRAAGHLRNLLAAWFGDPESYELLPRRDAGDGHSMLATLARADLGALVLLGQNPVRGSANPKGVAAALRRLPLMVTIDPFLTETARFWEEAPDCATEVIALPAAAFSEKPGSRTNACRLVQWQDACEAPRGEAWPDAAIVDALFHRLRAHVPALARARWPRGDLYRETFAEIAGWGVRGTADLRPDGSTPCGCWLYAGAGRGRWHWPDGRARLLEGATPPNSAGRVRLWAGPDGTDDAIADGPLPEHYEAPQSPHPNLLHPSVPHHPTLRIVSGAQEPADGFPLLMSTAIAPSQEARCRPRRRDEAPEVRVAEAVARALQLTDGARVWLETPRARARAVLRVQAHGADRLVWAPSTWTLFAEEETPDMVIADPGDPASLAVEVRVVPCRIRAR